jgi:hypothetical protein
MIWSIQHVYWSEINVFPSGSIRAHRMRSARSTLSKIDPSIGIAAKPQITARLSTQDVAVAVARME